MLRLPEVTLICLTGVDLKKHKTAFDISQACIEFGGAKIIYDEKITSIGKWNEAIIFDLPKYVDTTHAMLIHADGFIRNPYLWKPEWMEYDYIGAPWPLPTDDYSYRDESGELQRVGNSVSLRSKKLMDLIATRPMKYHYGNNNEDGQICCHNRKWLESQGCRFAPLEVAKHFSMEHEIPENEGLATFAFHSL